jgi:hypothetical protein
MNNEAINSYFNKKPKTLAFFSTIVAYVHTLGTIKQTVKKQISFSVNRKFLWFWVYDKTPDGTLYMTVCLDEKIDDPHFHYVNQISANRWNHHVVVKSEDIATSSWVKRLVRAGYKFAVK